jgi:hypothetical protein
MTQIFPKKRHHARGASTQALMTLAASDFQFQFVGEGDHLALP